MSHQFWCDQNGPFAETKSGTVRGYKLDDLYIFHGIKYATAKRFEMPVPIPHWDGFKDAITYGPVCPTMQKPSVGPMKMHVLDPCFGYRFWPEDEDCLYVNVWTKGLHDGKKRPVMVWIHGGGYSTGSSVEQHSYEPGHLVSENDVVVVSLNHRLNILGFFDMSDYGGKYAHSNNMGLVDLVEALKWVRDNIEEFGGDPGNVTVFGQSGGGYKIQALLQMPVAKDLFHKAIMQSGIDYPYPDEDKKAEDVKKVTEAVLKELGLTAETADEIQNIPFDDLRKAYLKVNPELTAKGINTGFGPVKDDYYLGNACTSGFSEKAVNTPVLCGTCQAEHYHLLGDFSDYHMPYEEKYERVKEKFGEYTDEMIEVFKKAYPDDDILNLFHMDWFWRKGTTAYLEQKTALGGPNCYNYIIAYTYRAFGGSPTFHGSCLPLVFNNTSEILVFNEPATVKLGMQMSRAWASFARTGDPNHEFMPEWKNFTNEQRATMVFCENSECRINHDKELIDKHLEYLPYKDTFEMIMGARRRHIEADQLMKS